MPWVRSERIFSFLEIAAIPTATVTAHAAPPSQSSLAAQCCRFLECSSGCIYDDDDTKRRTNTIQQPFVTRTAVHHQSAVSTFLAAVLAAVLARTGMFTYLPTHEKGSEYTSHSLHFTAAGVPPSLGSRDGVGYDGDQKQ